MVKEVRGESGHALLFALFALFILGLSISLGALAVQIGFREHRREMARVHVALLVDGVVAETLGSLVGDRGFKGVQRRASAEGEVWSDVRWQAETVVIDAGAEWGQRSEGAILKARRTPAGFRILSWRRLGGSDAVSP